MFSFEVSYNIVMVVFEWVCFVFRYAVEVSALSWPFFVVMYIFLVVSLSVLMLSLLGVMSGMVH